LRPPPCIAATWLTGDRCVPSRQRHLSGCCARHTTARPSTARAPSNAFAAAAPERVANAPALAVASSRCAAAVAVRAWAWRARRAFLCGSALQMMLADPRRVMLLRTFLQRRDGATPARFAVAAHTPPPSTAMFRRRTFSLAAAPSSCRPARTQTPTCTSAMRPPPRPSGGWAQSTVLSPRHAAPTYQNQAMSIAAHKPPRAAAAPLRRPYTSSRRCNGTIPPRRCPSHVALFASRWLLLLPASRRRVRVVPAVARSLLPSAHPF